MIIWRLILAVITIAFGYGAYYNYSHIHTPIPPEAVSIPLGEQNRNEQFVLSGYREVAEPYIVHLDVSLATLPKSAWCHKNSWSESKLGFDCTWPTPGGITRFATGEVEIALESKDVYAWDFDRTTLSAVPEMKGWFSVNFENMSGLIVCGLMFIICLPFLVTKWGIDPGYRYRPAPLWDD